SSKGVLWTMAGEAIARTGMLWRGGGAHKSGAAAPRGAAATPRGGAPLPPGEGPGAAPVGGPPVLAGGGGGAPPPAVERVVRRGARRVAARLIELAEAQVDAGAVDGIEVAVDDRRRGEVLLEHRDRRIGAPFVVERAPEAREGADRAAPLVALPEFVQRHV